MSRQWAVHRGLFCLGIGVLMVFTVGGDVWAQGTTEPVKATTVIEVGLAEVLKLALEESRQIEVARLQVRAAQHALQATAKRRHPVLSNQLSQSETVTSASGGAAFANLNRNRTTTVNASVTHSLNNGIAYGLTLAESRLQSQSLTIEEEGDSPDVEPWQDPLHTNTLTGFVNVPLFQDWGETVNEIPTRLQEVAVDQSQIDETQSQLSVLRFVAETYWDLVGVWETQRVQQEAVKLSERLLAENQLQLEVGTLTSSDVQATETQLVRERQQLLNTENQLRNVEDALRVALNFEQLNVSFYPQEVPTLDKAILPPKELLSRLWAKDTSLQSLQTSLERVRWELVDIENEDRTDLDLEVSYTLQGYASDSFQGTTYWGEEALNGFQAALTWTVPLGNQVTPNELQQKRLEREQLLLQIQDTKADLQNQLNTALRALTLATQSVASSVRVRELTDLQLQSEIIRLQEGQTTSFQVAQFQQELSRAREDEILARIQYEKAYLDLLILTQDLLGHYGLAVEPTSNSVE